MFHSVSQEELRAYCRNCIESFETWARRLIHERMVEKYGNNYVDAIIKTLHSTFGFDEMILRGEKTAK